MMSNTRESLSDNKVSLSFNNDLCRNGVLFLFHLQQTAMFSGGIAFAVCLFAKPQNVMNRSF